MGAAGWELETFLRVRSYARGVAVRMLRCTVIVGSSKFNGLRNPPRLSFEQLRQHRRLDPM